MLIDCLKKIKGFTPEEVEEMTSAYTSAVEGGASKYEASIEAVTGYHKGLVEQFGVIKRVRYKAPKKPPYTIPDDGVIRIGSIAAGKTTRLAATIVAYLEKDGFTVLSVSRSNTSNSRYVNVAPEHEHDWPIVIRVSDHRPGHLRSYPIDIRLGDDVSNIALRLKNYIKESNKLDKQFREQQERDRILRGSILRQVPDSPFYSRVESIIKDKMPARASAAQVTALLAKNGVKELDPEFQALKVWLPERVSKEDVLAFVEANRVVVSEVVKGSNLDNKDIDILRKGGIEVERNEDDPDSPLGFFLDGDFIDSAEAKEAVKNGEITQEVADAIKRLEDADDNSSKTKFDQWQLPGESENYREEFLTAPENATSYRVYARKGGSSFDKTYSDFMEASNSAENLRSQGYDANTVPILSDKNWKDGHSDYDDIVNPIVRVRYNSRTTTDGDKMLFGEEIQQPSKDNLAKMPKVYQKFGEEMAIRKMLYRAVEGGYDWFGFTTGQQQADRYDLSKKVKEVNWQENKDGSFNISPIMLDGSPIPQRSAGELSNLKPEDLDGVIGKEAADKIREHHGLEWAGRDVKQGKLTNLDLKVGGEGLIRRYDVKHVDYINKLMKPYGVRVEAKEIRTVADSSGTTWKDARVVPETLENGTETGGYEVFATRKDNGKEHRIGTFDSKVEAEAEAAYVTGNGKTETIHAARISPEFKAAVKAAMRDHGGAFPLFKQPENRADLNELKTKYLDELAPDVKTEYKGDNVVEINAEASEVIRTALAAVQDTKREAQAVVGSLFTEPQNASGLIEAIDEIGIVLDENGIDTKQVKALVKNIEKASESDGTVIFDGGGFKHEEDHYASWKGAARKELSVRYHNLKSLVSDKLFSTAFNGWVKLEGRNWKADNASPVQLGHAAEEIARYIADGDHARLGLTEREGDKLAVELGLRYAQARIEENPDLTVAQALATFDGTNTGQYIEAINNEATRQSNEGDVQSEGTGQDQGYKQSDASDEAGDGEGVSGSETFTPGGPEKLSQSPTTMRGNVAAFEEVEDRTYLSTTNDERQEFANSILDKGITYARNWLDEQIKNGDNNAGATQAVGLTLMNHYAQNGGVEAMNEIAKKIITKGTDNAQAVQAMSMVSQFDPDSAASYASLLKQRKTGKDLTDAERRKATDIATTLSETAKVEGIGDAVQQDLENYIRELTAENEAIKEALADKPSESKTDVANLKRQLTRWKNKALGLSDTAGRMTRTHQELLGRKSDILERLRQKFPDAVLRMVAWHGSPHTFDKFSTEKIGTGEGAQAYGHGLYFSSKEEVAQYYKDALARRHGDVVDANGGMISGRNYLDTPGKDIAIGALLSAKGDYTQARIEASGEGKISIPRRNHLGIERDEVIRKAQQYLNEFEKNGVTYIDPDKGAKYRVELKPAEDEYLDWDKPLSEQSPKVQRLWGEAIENQSLEDEFQGSSQNGSALYAALENQFGMSDWRGGGENGARQASDYLHSLGIRGIRYLDGSSRGKGEGSSNYVIFSDEDVEILEVLRSTPSNFDDNTRQDLIDYAALNILEGKSYDDVIKHLNDVTKGVLNEAEVKSIHANAVMAIRGERPSTTMDEATRQKIKNRNEHIREAKKFQGSSKNPNLSRLEREIANIATDDKVRISAIIQARTPDLKTWNDLISEVYDLDKAGTRELYRKGRELRDEAKKNLEKLRRQNETELKLSEDDLARIKEERRVNNAQASKTRREADNFYNGLVRSKADVVADTVVNLRRANLLTGIKTHFRNILGNTVFGVTEEVQRPVAWLADRGAGLVTGEKTVGGINAKSIINSFYNTVAKDEVFKNIDKETGIEAAKHILRYGDSQENMERMQHSESVLAEKFPGRPAKWIDNYINGVFRTLGAEDAIFKVYAFRRSLEEQATALAKTEGGNWKERRGDLLRHPTETMQIVASDFANFMTFQNDNILSNLFTKFKRLHPGVRTVAETIVPYDRTPTNIVMRVAEHLPIAGQVIAGKQLLDLRRGPDKNFRNRYRGAVQTDLMTSDEWNKLDENEKRKAIDDGIAKVWSREKQAKFARTVGRSSLGSSLFFTGFGLAALGLLTGSMGPEDDDKKETGEFFDRRSKGIENKSLLIPGVGRFVLPDDPASKTIGAGATFYEQMMMSKGDVVSKAWDAAGEVTKDAMFEQPLMGNVGQLYQTIKKGKYGEFAGQLLGGMVPTMASDVGEVLDDKARTTSGYKPRIPGTQQTTMDRLAQQGRGFRNSFLRRIPLVRQFADESKAVPSDIRGGILRRAARMIDPFNTRPATSYTPPEAKPGVDNYLNSPEFKKATTDDLVDVLMNEDMPASDRDKIKEALKKKAKNAQKGRTLTREEVDRIKKVLPEFNITAREKKR